MPDTTTTAAPAPAVTTTTAPAEAKDPAASTEATATKAPSLADLKSARRAAPTPGVATTTAPVTPPAAVTTTTEPAKGTATIEMDEGALKQFSTLSRELREAKTKVKEYETKIAGFGKFEKAQALAKDGKHYDAAREAGIDVDAALAELLGKNEGNATAAQIDQALAKRLDDLETFKNDTLKEREDRKKANAEDTVKQDRAVTGKFITDNAAQYPHLAKASEYADGVFADYTTSKTKLEAENGEPLSNAEQAKLMLSALAVHEEKWAKVHGAQPKPAGESTQGVDEGVRSGVRQAATPVAKKMTFDELKAERAAKKIATRNA